MTPLHNYKLLPLWQYVHPKGIFQRALPFKVIIPLMVLQNVPFIQDTIVLKLSRICKCNVSLLLVVAGRWTQLLFKKNYLGGGGGF